MAVNVGDEDSVLIILSANSPSSMAYPERRILLTRSQPTLKIGRSSNRSGMGLIATPTNGYFDSPVMSREHAELEADIPGQILRIRDAGSMHGTYLNNEQLGTKTARLLVAGDQVTFGLPVYRNLKTFQPATVTVGMEFRNAGRTDQSPSRVFTVPDDCSTDENEPSDDSIPRASITAEREENSWHEKAVVHAHEMHQVDGVIEIESGSESDAPPEYACSISSSDFEEEVLEAVELSRGLNDDEESTSLTDDAQTNSAAVSPIESIDFGDAVLTDNNGARTPSWDSVSTDLESEHMCEHVPSCHDSEDEQGIFLYDSESDEMDETAPLDADFDSCSQSVNYPDLFPAVHSAHQVQLTNPTHPVLPSISTAVFSQPYTQVTPFGYQLAPVLQPAARHPSPSDAVLPLSRRHHGSEDDCSVTVESMGRKSGKPDFFEARERNKIDIAYNASFSSEANPAIEAASKTATEENNWNENLTDCLASASTEFGKLSFLTEVFPSVSSEKAANQPTATQASEGATEGQNNQAAQVSKSPYVPALLDSDAVYLKSPIAEPLEENMQAPEYDDLGWAAVSADESSRSKQPAQIRVDRTSRSLYGPPYFGLPSEFSTKLQKDNVKGKRKAVEISEATDQELVWHEQSAAVPQPSPSSPSIAQPEIDTGTLINSPPTTPERGSAAARPTKIRKIAERVGYAALGGATVGAMVLTSLIYTAPNFA